MDKARLSRREFLEYIRSELDVSNESFDPFDGAVRSVLMLGDSIYWQTPRNRESRQVYAAMSCGVNCEDIGTYGPSSNAAFVMESIIHATAWRVIIDLYFSNDVVFDVLCDKIKESDGDDFSRVKINVMRLWDAIREAENKETDRG